MQAEPETPEQRVAARLPAARALPIFKALAILVVAPMAWYPLQGSWRMWFLFANGGGAAACLLLCWLDRGFRRSPEAMIASIVGFGAHAITLALGLVGHQTAKHQLGSTPETGEMHGGWPWVYVTKIEVFTPPMGFDGNLVFHLWDYALTILLWCVVLTGVLWFNRQRLSLRGLRVMQVVVVLAYLGAALAIWDRICRFAV